MKITAVTTDAHRLAVANSGPESSFAISDKNKLRTLLIKIETDKGIIGWGEPLDIFN